METLEIAVITHTYPSEGIHAGAFTQARVELYREMGHAVDLFVRGTEEPSSPRNYDVVAAHYPLPEYVIPTARRFLPGTPVVAYLHGSEAITRGVRDFHPYRMKSRWQLKRFLRECQASVTESRWMQQEIRKYLGVTAEVIPNPVDPSLFPLMLHSTRKGLCLRGRGWKYGTDLLETILPSLADRDIIVDNLDPVYSRLELPKLLANYGFFVLPSRMEGQGVMACEAAATGMPVVATNVGGIPEFIIDNESTLCPPSSATELESSIVEMWGKLPLDEERRAGIRESILAICGPEVTVDRDIELFRSLT
ncbi:MAG: glycosyltransferase family 4 protein [Thermoplasmata archaeon]